MVDDERHQQTRELLPWYLSGTLPSPEAGAVEAHLQTCPRCQGELAELRQLKTAVRSAVEARPAPSPDLFARIAARVDAAEARHRPPPGSSWWRSRIQEFAAALLAPRLAPAFAVAMIVLQFGAIAVLGSRLYQVTHGGGATTQSGPDTRPRIADGVAVRVAFQERATEREIRTVLQAEGAQIVEGPSAAGFYVVVVPRATADRALERLRNQTSVVRFVEAMPPG